MKFDMINVNDARMMMPSVRAMRERNAQLQEEIEQAIIDSAKKDKEYLIFKDHYISEIVINRFRDNGFEIEPLYETERWNGSVVKMDYKISW